MSDELLKDMPKDAPSSPKVHPEDRARSRNRSHSRSEDEKDYENLEQVEGGADALQSAPSAPIFTSGVSHNTGVKGVIADAQSFASHRRMQKQSLKQAPSNLSEDVNSATIASPTEELSSDDELMASWRKNRLAELKAAVANNRRSSPSKRIYGKLEEVDANGYLDAVEKVGPETVVVVAVYDKLSSESAHIEDCLASIAGRYLTTRFIKLHHDIAEMDPEVVPAVLAYKSGELFANIPRIVDEIPPGFSLNASSLEKTLLREGILHSS